MLNAIRYLKTVTTHWAKVTAGRRGLSARGTKAPLVEHQKLRGHTLARFGARRNHTENS